MIDTSSLFAWQRRHEERLSLWLNHLLVVYAFFLPLDHPRAGWFMAWVMFGLVVVRGNYRQFFETALKHPVSIAFLIFYALHWVWNLTLENPPILVHTFKENMEYALLVPLIMGFIDSRFVTRVVSSFLIAVMMSEVISYGMYFEFLPTEWIYRGVVLPWHELPQDILLYSQGGFYTSEPAAFIKHSLYTAALAFCVAVMAYKLLNRSLGTMNKVLFIFFMITMTYNISLVGGRAGYFIYIVLLVIVVLFSFPKKAFFSFAVLMGVVTLAGWSAYHISPMFEKRVDITVKNFRAIYHDPTNFNSSEGGRIGMWYYGSDVIHENFWFGTSQADFVKPVHERIPHPDRKRFKKWYFMPHSFYLSTLLQFGFIGFVLLMNIYVQALRKYESDRENYAIRVLAVVTVAMSLLSTDPIDYFLFPFLAVIVAITTLPKLYLRELKPVSAATILGYAGAGIIVLGVAILQ